MPWSNRPWTVSNNGSCCPPSPLRMERRCQAPTTLAYDSARHRAGQEAVRGGARSAVDRGHRAGVRRRHPPRPSRRSPPSCTGAAFQNPAPHRSPRRSGRRTAAQARTGWSSGSSGCIAVCAEAHQFMTGGPFDGAKPAVRPAVVRDLGLYCARPCNELVRDGVRTHLRITWRRGGTTWAVGPSVVAGDVSGRPAGAVVPGARRRARAPRGRAPGRRGQAAQRSAAGARSAPLWSRRRRRLPRGRARPRRRRPGRRAVPERSGRRRRTHRCGAGRPPSRAPVRRGHRRRRRRIAPGQAAGVVAVARGCDGVTDCRRSSRSVAVLRGAGRTARARRRRTVRGRSGD